MMGILTVLALLIAIFAVIFALQNSSPILVQFLGWQTEESMALVLLLTFTFGVLFGLLVSLPTLIKGMRQLANLKRKISEKNYEIEQLDHNLTAVTNQVQSLQESQIHSQSEPINDQQDYSSNISEY
ncbi:LapA family protein [Anabaena sp. CCY 9402-a]|uniref:LapA family protein n=1 Tax=Anabaena sp. CCY 9402-a TaxID=3103867 RepID=UPI0039C6846F